MPRKYPTGKPPTAVYAGRRVPDHPGAELSTVSDTVVTVDGTAMPLGRSLKLRNHSPTGFNWGYGGSGPSQLALAILLDYYGKPDVATRLYHFFKAAFVTHWGDEWQITGAQIDAWRVAYEGADRPRTFARRE
jgi:hypothetical protein